MTGWMPHTFFWGGGGGGGGRGVYRCNFHLTSGNVTWWVGMGIVKVLTVLLLLSILLIDPVL